ncbi:TRAP transporter small permease [Corticicoccus populi]|uniref:TRAP transporter small permease n=1 Tax=Corticicoccus populi TaxID=1812821 RepID=A0ABW5WYX2_9STAP
MSRFVKTLEKIQVTIGIIALLIFFTAILIQILTRYLGWSVLWTEEVSTYSFIWAMFMGASVMVNHREHFSFDTLQYKLSEINRNRLNMFIDSLLIAFNLFIVSYGITIINHFWNYRWETVPFMKMGYVWLVIPVMAVSMIIYSLHHIIERVKNNKNRSEKEVV